MIANNIFVYLYTFDVDLFILKKKIMEKNMKNVDEDARLI